MDVRRLRFWLRQVGSERLEMSQDEALWSAAECRHLACGVDHRIEPQTLIDVVLHLLTTPLYVHATRRSRIHRAAESIAERSVCPAPHLRFREARPAHQTR